VPKYSSKGRDKDEGKSKAGRVKRGGRGRGQKAEGRRQRAEGRGQKAEGRGKREEERGKSKEERGGGQSIWQKL